MTKYLDESGFSHVWSRIKLLLEGKQDNPTTGAADNWQYRIYADGTFEAWYKATGQNLTINNASGNLYRSNLTTLTLPAAINAVSVQHVSVNVAHNNYPCWGMLASLGASSFNYYAMSGGSRSASPNYLITAYAFGKCS